MSITYRSSPSLQRFRASIGSLWLSLNLLFKVVLGSTHNQSVYTMQSTHPSIVAAPLQGQQVPQLHTHHFWENRLVKTLFNKTTHTNNALIKQCEKVSFLKACLKKDIVPVTCKAKYNPLESFSAEGHMSIEKVKHSLSINVLKVSIREAEKNIPGLKTSFFNSLSALQFEAKNDCLLLREIREKVNFSGNRVIIQCQNKHRQNLQNLSPTPIIYFQPKKKGKQRGFMKRSKHRRLQNKNASRPLPCLVENFSDTAIEGTSRESVLNLGLNFVPTRPQPNTTQISANL